MGDQVEPNLTTDQQSDKARKQKVWGLCLLGGGVATELLGFIGAYSIFELFAVRTLMVGGILSCMIGIALYGTAKGNKWGWIVFACAIAIVPFIGPFVAIGYINTPRKLGLTLGIVGAIALILAIAIPNFVLMEPKSRQSEAKFEVQGMLESAMAMKEKTGTFAISDISHLGYLQQPYDTRYSLWYAVNGVPQALPLPPGARYRTSPCDVTIPPATVKVEASATGFTAAAKGNVDDDATCDEWSINEKKELKNTLNDVVQ